MRTPRTSSPRSLSGNRSIEKHRKVVLNSGAGESTDEVRQQRIAALSAWKTKFKKPPDEEAPLNKVKARLCLRGERTWGETLD